MTRRNQTGSENAETFEKTHKTKQKKPNLHNSKLKGIKEYKEKFSSNLGEVNRVRPSEKKRKKKRI